MGQEKKKGNTVDTEKAKKTLEDLKSAEKKRLFNQIFLTVFVAFSMIGVYYIISKTGENTVENNDKTPKGGPKMEHRGELNRKVEKEN